MRGLRLVHTHLQSEPLSQDDLMDLVFLRLDCVAAVRVDQNGGATQLEVAHILPGSVAGNGHGWDVLPLMPCHDPDLDFQALVKSLEDELDRNRLALPAPRSGEDRAILVSITESGRQTAQSSMEELVELARTEELPLRIRSSRGSVKKIQNT